MKWFDDWKHIALVLGGLAILTAGCVLMPAALWDRLGRLVAHTAADPSGALAAVVSIGGVATAIGGLIGGFRAAYLRALATPVPADAPAGPRRVPPSRTEGSVAIDVMGSIIILAGIVLAWLTHLRHLWPVVLVCALAGASLTGCGAGALVAQGRAATIASVAIGSVGQELHDARTEQLDACTDTGCTDAGERLWAPAVAAYESVRAALDTWIGALEVAQQAGAQDGDVLGALFVALTRLAREWNQLAAAIRGLGIPELQPPDMPPIVTALLGAAS